MNPFYKYEIEKQIELADNLPHILGNPIQIKQIMDNLIKNAIDAMENSPKKRLTIKTHMESSSVIIKISDTGEGIAKENLTEIFSPDFTTKPISKGTGLGLASVKTMIEAYSGDIRVESEIGKGTAFLLLIPINSPTVHTPVL